MILSLADEIWEPILGYENLYSVSNKGRVKAHAKEWLWSRNPNRKNTPKKTEEKILSPAITEGYYRVSLNKKCKAAHRFIHRLMGIAFIPNPENKPQINHKDGDKLNNSLSNLEWCTISENSKHAHNMGLAFSNAIVLRKAVMCDTLGISFLSVREAARELNISGSRVSEICRGIIVHTKGLTFRYL